MWHTWGMSDAEFDEWLDAHYISLVNNAGEMGDSVARVVLRLTRDRALLHSVLNLVPFIVSLSRGDMRNRVSSEAKKTRKLMMFAADLESLGDDVYLDIEPERLLARRRAKRSGTQHGFVGTRHIANPTTNPRSIQKNKRRRERVEQQRKEEAESIAASWLMGGTAGLRWVYQQRRDAKLYDIQALRSLGEHIRGRSSRSLHGAGCSLVHWGEEGRPVRPWGKEVAGYMGSTSWAFVSCSTGTKYLRLRFGMGSPHRHARCGGCSEHAISGRHDKACALKRSAA